MGESKGLVEWSQGIRFIARDLVLFVVACLFGAVLRSISVVYATGYNADIRGIRHKYYIRGIQTLGYPQVSVVYDQRILARNLAHSP